MAKKVLITGGAGFIGSHLTDELLSHGHQVVVLDNLHHQVHPSSQVRPPYLHPEAELIIGDIRDPEAVKKSLKGIDVVFHLAARVGVGQSMYEIRHYCEANDLGTAILMEIISKRPVEKIIVASSMSIYGEGLYQTPKGYLINNAHRSLCQLQKGQWEITINQNVPLNPIPTPETKTPMLNSVYALSKYHQEKLCLILGNAYKIPTIALRFFNVYGTRQSLSNPYTGVLAIFSSRLLNNQAPQIFEDGKQKRDFVSVKDVVMACRLALESKKAIGEEINIGSGQSMTIDEVALKLAKVLGKEHLRPEISQQYRIGDIRHCFAHIGKAKSLLNYTPQTSMDHAFTQLAEWVAVQKSWSHSDQAKFELSTRGLTF